jgi:hypothetical protein
MSSSSTGHASNQPSTSKIKVGEKKSRFKLICRLCEGSHQTHLCPRMDEASKILEYMIVSQPQLPTASCKLSLDLTLVSKVVNPVSSSFDPTLPLKSEVKVVILSPSPVDPTLPRKREVQEIDSTPSSIDPTLPLKIEFKEVIPTASSVDRTLPLESGVHQLVDPVPSLVDHALPLKIKIQVIDLIPSSVDPTLPLESEFDITHVFLVNTNSSIQGGIYPSTLEPPPRSEAILFYWHGIIVPRLPSYVPFQIIVRVCGRDVPNTIVDEGAFVSILSSTAWKDLVCPRLVSVT